MMDVLSVQNEGAISYNKTINPRFSKVCEPLEIINVRAFVYYRIFEDGQYILLSNNCRLVSQTVEKFDGIGMLFRQAIKRAQKNRYHFLVWPENAEDKMIQFYSQKLGLGNGMSIYRRLKDVSVVGWTFLVDADNTHILSDYVNYRDVFVRFVEYFEQKAKDLILPEAGAVKARYPGSVDIGPVKEPALDLRGFSAGINDNAPTVRLTEREKRVLELLCQGRSMKEMGNFMGISPRTVESHIQNVKKKTKLHYKSELIDFYCRQEMIY